MWDFSWSWNYFYIAVVFAVTFYMGLFFVLLGVIGKGKDCVKKHLIFASSHFAMVILVAYFSSVLSKNVQFYKDNFSWLSYLIDYVADIFIIKLLTGSGWVTSLFVLNVGYCYQHVCQYFYQILLLAINIGMFTVWGRIIRIVFMLLYGAIFYFLTRKRLAYVDEMRIKQASMLLVSSVVIIAAAVILNMIAYNISVSMEKKTMTYCVLLFSGLIAFLTMTLDLNILESDAVNAELQQTKKILHNQKSFYAKEKAVVDSINIKSHDLKHHLLDIQGSISKESYEELNKLILDYETFQDTGNKAIDVILTERNALCNEKDIRFTCLVNGSKLSFINENDLYALFGNILDNAIEAVSKIDVKDRRVVSLSTEEKNGFISIRCENYYQGKLILKNGVPQTTKENKDYHGFGLKSISIIVNKYGGNVSISHNHEIFTIDILFPIPTDKK